MMGKMKYELKIIMPVYKIVYASFFIIVLSLVRGVAYTCEIGVALEAPLGILAAAFCADTYVQEIVSKRSEVQRLYPMNRRICSVGIRLVIQGAFLMVLAAAGYGLFSLFQKPVSVRDQGGVSETVQFLIYLGAAAATLCFWGILSNTIAVILRNLWAGIGGTLIIWLLMNSTFGERILGSWNLFSYTFRNITDGGDYSWLPGKGLCIAFSVVMLLLLPIILKKRG